MKKHLFYSLLTFSIFSASIFAQNTQLSSKRDSTRIEKLEKRIKALEEKIEENELQKILQEANTISEKKKESNGNKVFKSGQRALQAINPEISVTGDAMGEYNFEDIPLKNNGGVFFRGLGLHIQSNLDPFSLAKVAIGFSPEGVGLGEAYLTWTNILPNISLTAGKFRQQFGVLNRWHKHALDQFDFPLPIKAIFGNEGLNQIGFSFNWLLPSFTADANNLTIEITNAQNKNLFAGKTFSFPATLIHFKNYWDLSRDTYLELGFTGMFGKNKLPIADENNNIVSEASRNTLLGGVDLTLFWEPVNNALYKSFLWRSEIYYAKKELLSNQEIKTLGGYSYVEYKFAEQWQTGIRFDYTQPFELNNDSNYSYQIVPYITWWQSHWVKMRLQYNYLDGNIISVPKNTLRLQIVWAVGPHKHDRY